MCGISGYFCREQGELPEVLLPLFKEAEKRGTDGFGYYKWNIYDKTHTEYKACNPIYVLNSIKLKRGDILLANHRAAPETETAVNIEDLEKTVQPLIYEDIVLVHNGAVSDSIVKIFKSNMISNIDSEAIIHAYLAHDRDMKQTMEFLVGGFAFLLLDQTKEKLYAVTSHNPLYNGYVKGHGLFFSSTMDGIYNTVSYLKGHPIQKNLMCVWEDYYANKMPEYNIVEIDLPSGMCNDISYEPRYVTSTYDTYFQSKIKTNKVLVASSGGLDSSTTLAILKHSGYNPIAVHFQYGHRGEHAELIAIHNITEILDIPLVTFDITENMKQLDHGMLTDANAEITTGTNDCLKTTAAWTTFRNHFFLTYMGALAESIMMKDNDDCISITGGYMNITESGVYPDNSERFVQAAIDFFKYSITGSRIKPLFGLCNLLKTDQYILLNKLGYLEELSPWLVSCDRPIVKNGKPYNCSKNGVPACGSGLLSYWASKIAGVEDKRNFYEIESEVEEYKLNSELKVKEFDLDQILNKINIPEINKSILKANLGR